MNNVHNRTTHTTVHDSPAICRALAATWADSHAPVTYACRRGNFPSPHEGEAQPVRAAITPRTPFQITSRPAGEGECDDPREIAPEGEGKPECVYYPPYKSTVTGRLVDPTPNWQEVPRADHARAAAARILQSGELIGLTAQQAKAHGVRELDPVDIAKDHDTAFPTASGAELSAICAMYGVVRVKGQTDAELRDAFVRLRPGSSIARHYRANLPLAPRVELSPKYPGPRIWSGSAWVTPDTQAAADALLKNPMAFADSLGFQRYTSINPLPAVDYKHWAELESHMRDWWEKRARAAAKKAQVPPEKSWPAKPALQPEKPEYSRGAVLFFAATGHPPAVWNKMGAYQRGVWERKAEGGK